MFRHCSTESATGGTLISGPNPHAFGAARKKAVLVFSLRSSTSHTSRTLFGQFIGSFLCHPCSFGSQQLLPSIAHKLSLASLPKVFPTFCGQFGRRVVSLLAFRSTPLRMNRYYYRQCMHENESWPSESAYILTSLHGGRDSRRDVAMRHCPHFFPILRANGIFGPFSSQKMGYLVRNCVILI